MKNRSVPSMSVVPHLVYRSVSDACDWLTRVFGFTEHFRYGDPVSGIQLYLGEAVVMLSGPREGRESPTTVGQNTQMLTIIVPDVEAHYKTAKREGAQIWEELHVTEYGEHQYGTVDLDGHRWLFAQHARDVSPDEWGATLVMPPQRG
jgi:uncharacterized glyoxalase superfamily protein PhnB